MLLKKNSLEKTLKTTQIRQEYFLSFFVGCFASFGFS
jgi:hypothetical protein